MKIQNLMENIFDKNHSQYSIHKEPYVFKNDGKEIDGAFSIINNSNGVIYAVDVDINLENNQYTIKDIDVQDHGNTYDGDAEDKHLITNYINDNFRDLVHLFNNVSEDNDMRNL